MLRILSTIYCFRKRVAYIKLSYYFIGDAIDKNKKKMFTARLDKFKI